MGDDALREHYRSEFDPVAYHQAVKDFGFLFTFFQRALHDIFNSDVVNGEKLVEFGCGPTPFNVFPASKKFRDVVLSEFLPQNREALKKWVNQDPDAFDWSFISEQTAALEGYSDIRRGAKEIEERTRKAIKHVLPGDAFDLTSIPEQYRSGYDVLVSSQCFESAATNLEAYEIAVRNVGSMVKPGGSFIQCGALGSVGYLLGGVRFENMCLTEGIAKDAVQKAGFEVETWQAVDNEKEVEGYDCAYTGAFVLTARRV